MKCDDGRVYFEVQITTQNSNSLSRCMLSPSGGPFRSEIDCGTFFALVLAR